MNAEDLPKTPDPFLKIISVAVSRVNAMTPTERVGLHMDQRASWGRSGLNTTSQLIAATLTISYLSERNATLESACTSMNGEVCDILGKALGYPWYKNDQENFPGATEKDGVCVGDHVAESIASEAAKRIIILEGVIATCSVRFREYEGSHASKRTPDGDAKATRNAEMADMCEKALGQSCKDEGCPHFGTRHSHA